MHLFRRYRIGTANLYIFHGLVTLKIRTGEKSLVIIHPQVQKISQQKEATRTPAPTGSATNQCHPNHMSSLRLGDKTVMLNYMDIPVQLLPTHKHLLDPHSFHSYNWHYMFSHTDALIYSFFQFVYHALRHWLYLVFVQSLKRYQSRDLSENRVFLSYLFRVLAKHEAWANTGRS